MEKEAQAEYAELLRRLYEAISSLPPTQARRVHARYMLGMKVKDIAAMEGITPSQAGKSIHAALRRLRRYFERRKVYHHAWYSLDAYSWTENYALEHGRSPEEILLEREERAARLRLVAALPEALAHATPTQARRVRAYYIAGISQPEISRREGVDSSKVSIAIRRGLRNMRRCYDGLFPSE